MMPRIFWEGQVNVGDTITVAGDDGHHFARVLRAKTGEQATVAAAATGYLATIAAVDKQAGTVELVIEEQLQKRDAKHLVYLVQAMAKADKVDTVIQKSTEVGAAGVLLYESQRSVVKLKQDKVAGKLDRWRKVAKEAAVQCQRDTIPVIEYASDFSDVVQWIRHLERTNVLLLDEGESVYGLRTALNQIPAGAHIDARSLPAEASASEQSESEQLESRQSESEQSASGQSESEHLDTGESATEPSFQQTSIVIVTGPEGGWSDEERQQWTEAKAKSVTLGPRILRTETAGVAALTAVLYQFGDLGG